MRLPTPFLTLTLSFLAASARMSSASSGDDLAVIVNKKTAVLALTSRDLRSILLGEKEHWPNGMKVVTASLATEHPETRLVLKQICGMSEGDYKRYFMQVMFQGKSATPPRFLTTPAAVKALVSVTPGAVGIIRVRDVDPSVDVVTVDGSTPGSSNYKLAMTE